MSCNALYDYIKVQVIEASTCTQILDYLPNLPITASIPFTLFCCAPIGKRSPVGGKNPDRSDLERLWARTGRLRGLFLAKDLERWNICPLLSGQSKFGCAPWCKILVSNELGISKYTLFFFWLTVGTNAAGEFLKRSSCMLPLDKEDANFVSESCWNNASSFWRSNSTGCEIDFGSSFVGPLLPSRGWLLQMKLANSDIGGDLVCLQSNRYSCFFVVR